MIKNKYLWLILIIILGSCSKKISTKNVNWILLSRTEKYKKKQIKRVEIDTLDIDKIKKLKYAVDFKYEQSIKFSLQSVIEVLLMKDSVKHLSLMNIDTLPNNVMEFKNLKSLYIGGKSSINRLPKNIDKLEKLEKLDLGTPFNHLSFVGYIDEIPTNFFKLKNLKALSLYGNPIAILPKEICNFDSLYFLNLIGTKIDYLPSCICQKENLIINTSNDSIYNTLPCKERFQSKYKISKPFVIEKPKLLPKWRIKYIQFYIWFIEHIKWPLGF
jgi:Leucine-rich repeat (LRR) protein